MWGCGADGQLGDGCYGNNHFRCYPTPVCSSHFSSNHAATLEYANNYLVGCEHSSIDQPIVYVACGTWHTVALDSVYFPVDCLFPPHRFF